MAPIKPQNAAKGGCCGSIHQRTFCRRNALVFIQGHANNWAKDKPVELTNCFYSFTLTSALVLTKTLVCRSRSMINRPGDARMPEYPDIQDLCQPTEQSPLLGQWLWHAGQSDDPARCNQSGQYCDECCLPPLW